MPDYLDLTPENLAEHHLCCALGDPKHESGVQRKKAWLARRMREGLVFRKLDVRGKVFIEYAPAEVAWRPIVAPGWLVVHCLWVSGRFAGKGHGRRLVESALQDARQRGSHGVVIASARRKRPFLSDPKFLRHLGFEEVDAVGEWRLFASAVDDGGQTPRFASSLRAGGAVTDPLHAEHTDQCPFNTHWAGEMAASFRARGHDVSVERLTTRRRAQRAASPLGAFGLTSADGLVSHHLLTDAAVARCLR